MSYRPYPNPERALKQLDRHYPPAPVIPLAERIRTAIRAGQERVVQQGFGAGTYVLSTRRPGVVSGGA
ncbi:hypothetical protein [Streptomyces sp. NPDC006355]|uniref:hypothetical protein n=1 Tax=Streptomyces sp. NPDC006355 TaxID=3156758 RepID=UPI0033B9603D